MVANVYVTRKTKYRIVWERCPDCGRSNTERPGGCYVVERKGLFGWRYALTEYDRGGNQQAKHFRTEVGAHMALDAARAPKAPDRIIVKENA